MERACGKHACLAVVLERSPKRKHGSQPGIESELLSSPQNLLISIEKYGDLRRMKRDDDEGSAETHTEYRALLL